MAATELRLVADAVCDEGTVGDIECVNAGRSRLLRFSADIPCESLTAIVGQLSASAALFAERDRPALLEPLIIDEHLVYGSELVTTQRYRGKTNERLTRAMVNIALATAGINPSRPEATVLDPMCGRGTTLNWALAYGLQAVGIDADRTSLDHHANFLQNWAKRNRLPHKMQRFKKTNAEHRHVDFAVGRNRTALRDGGQRLQSFHGDGGDRTLPIKQSSIDVIVADLPYGVQHRGSADGPDGDIPDTLELLQRVLPTWRRWVRPDGALCLAWNTKRAGRRALSRALASSGFIPVTAAGGYSMSHTVDATIDRDVMVAVRADRVS